MAYELIVIKRVKLGPHHLKPGRTRHWIHDSNGTRAFPPFVALEIAKNPSDEACYLFHIAEDGTLADTWHSSLEEAIEQAEFEFEVKADEWTEVLEPHTSDHKWW